MRYDRFIIINNLYLMYIILYLTPLYIDNIAPKSYKKYIYHKCKTPFNSLLLLVTTTHYVYLPVVGYYYIQEEIIYLLNYNIFEGNCSLLTSQFACISIGYN